MKIYLANDSVMEAPGIFKLGKMESPSTYKITPDFWQIFHASMETPGKKANIL